MAMLSTHPAIVTIYQAGVAGDGRPYLVMEYCPRPNLQLRCAQRDVLDRRGAARRRAGRRSGRDRAPGGRPAPRHQAGQHPRHGVQPAGADRLRHRLDDRRDRRGIRDVDPVVAAGVVRRPAAQRSAHRRLGAGRDPLHAARRAFALREAGGAQLQRRPHRAHRARRASPRWAARTPRRACSASSSARWRRIPDDRYPSAVAFARALQKVQIELAHSVTPIDIVDDHPPAEDLDDDGDGLTRVREIVSIDPDAAAFTRPSATTQPKSAAPALPDVPRFDPPERADSVDEATQMRVPARERAARGRRPDHRPAADGGRAARRGIRRRPPVAGARSRSPPHASASGAARRRRGLWIALSAVAAVVVVVATIVGPERPGRRDPDPARGDRDVRAAGCGLRLRSEGRGAERHPPGRA